MNVSINNIWQRHRDFWNQHTLVLLAWGVAWFLFAIVVQHFAYLYIDGHVVGTHVGDILLDNLPTINLDFFIVQGALISTALVLIFFLIHPKYFSFSLKTLALFIIIRSFFISLTHLGVNLHQLTLNTNSVGFGLYDFLYNAKNDFFFSGHVGASFLFALLFWKERAWSMVFFIFSFVFGVSMILAHMHYSIDVFAAPFMAYAIFTMAEHIFYHDYKLIS